MAELNLLPKKEHSPGCQQPSFFFLVLGLSVACQA